MYLNTSRHLRQLCLDGAIRLDSFYFLPAGENGSSRCQSASATASIIPFIQHAWQRTKGRSAADCLVLIPLRATEQFFQMPFQLLKCHFVQSSGLIFDTYLTRYLSQAIGSGR